MKTAKLDKKRPKFINIRTMPFDALYDMQGYITARHELFEKGCLSIALFLAITPAWFVVATILGILGESKVATFFVWLIPSSLFIALGIWLCLYFIIFPDIAQNKDLLYRIKRELLRRGKGEFSFASDN